MGWISTWSRSVEHCVWQLLHHVYVCMYLHVRVSLRMSPMLIWWWVCLHEVWLCSVVKVYSHLSTISHGMCASRGLHLYNTCSWALLDPIYVHVHVHAGCGLQLSTLKGSTYCWRWCHHRLGLPVRLSHPFLPSPSHSPTHSLFLLPKQNQSYTETIVLSSRNKVACKTMWKSCVENHSFFRWLARIN